MLFSSLLFLFVSFSTSKFDRYEKVHSHLEHCSDSTASTTLSIKATQNIDNYFIDCETIGSVSFSKSSFSSSNEIGSYLFSGSSVKSVSFSEEIQGLTIKEGAFSYSKLTSFSFDKVKGAITIEDGAFFGCEGLTSIKFPSTTNSIGESAFESCTALKPEFVTDGQTGINIKPYAFYNCKAIEALTLPTIGTIEDYAFAKCPKLKLSNIKATRVGDYAFYECTFNDLTIECGNVGEHAFQGKGSIKKFVTTTSCSFETYAFSGLKLPNPLNFDQCEFGDYVFANCDLTNVKQIEINGPTDIPKYCFANSQGMKDAKVILSSCSIGEHSFENLGQFTLKLDKTGSSLEIREYAFYNSKLNGDLLVPSTFSKIGTRAFALTGLNKALTIDHVPEIEPYAFQKCPIIGPVRIIGSDIGESAFEGCNTFSRLVIGLEETDANDEDDSIEYTSIEKRAFYGVHISESLYIHSSVGIIEEYAFASAAATPSNINIYAAEIKPFAFLNAGTITNLNIYSKVISFHSFDGCTITNLFIEYKDPLYAKLEEDIESGNADIEDLPSIKEQAFYGLKITNLDISHDYLIYKSAFQNCNFQGSLKINATAIDSYAFACCQSSPTCTVAVGDCYIRNYAFMNFSNIATLTFFGKSECKIDDYAFIGSGIKNDNVPLTFPSSVSSIGKCAFANITTLHPSILSIEANTIGDSAFEGCSQITIFELKEGITTIGERAFYGTSLSGPLTIPKSVTEIKSSSFENLKSLGEITLYSDSALKDIGPNAFGHSSISGPLQIPNSVEKIQSSAFIECTGLTSLMFYYNGELTYIYDNAFANCENINCNLDIPSSVVEIGEHAFANCKGIQGHLTLSLLCKVGNEAFQNCNSISSIVIKTDISNNGIDEIKANSFKNLNVFGDITIPISIEKIGDSAFEGCKDIQNVDFQRNQNDEIISSLTSIGDRAFYQSGITEFTIPRSVTKIGVSAFEGCEKLKELSFDTQNGVPGKLTIGSKAFYASGIEGRLTIPSHTESIGDYAFANCPNLMFPIRINGGKLGTGVFENCINIGSDDGDIYLSDTEIGPFAFKGCTDFVGTIYLESGCVLGESAFEGFISSGFTISLPTSQPTKAVGIGNRAFYGSSLTGSLTFRNNYVDYIGKEAFSHCNNINGSLTINIEDVRDGAFSYSSFAGKLTITADLGHSFNENTFRGCYGFSELVISGLTKVPARAFNKMSFFKGTLTIPTQCISIGEYAFAGCGFSQVVFAKTRTEDIDIERGAFSGIPEMVGLDNFPSTRMARLPTGDGTKKKLRDFMFYECSSLNSFSLKDIDQIGNYAFYGCSNLELKLDFTGIKSIGVGAFQGCSHLQGSLLIPTNLVEIKENAFAGCTGLSGSLTINVNALDSSGNAVGQTYIGSEAFKGCTGFKKGTLTIYVEGDEETKISGSQKYYYAYNYFLRIGHDAFKDCKFKNIYYNGRFQPDCDYDLGFSHTKAIHTSSNYVNKSFCSYPLHHDKLSGGAIAGITIAVIIVVAAIVVLVVYFIIKNKRNKDPSEAEVEMNADP